MCKFKIQILLFLAFFAIIQPGIAQEDCIVKLNEAEKLYESGKIEKIPEMLSNCLESGFNKENRISALRLLTLVYLFEDNQLKAENTLLRILKENPEFKINPAIDPVEFVRLYNSFNTAPIFSLGVSGGLSTSKPRLIETYTPNTFSDANSKYSNGGMGYSVGLKATYHLKNQIDLSFEPVLTSISIASSENVGENNVTTFNETSLFVDFPVYGTYTFYKYQNSSFLGEFGFIYGKLLSSTFNGILTYTDKVYPDYEGPSINTTAIRTDYLLQTSLGIGTSIKLPRSYLQLFLRYKFGLNNMVNTSQRLSNYSFMTSEYMHQDDDYSNTNFSFTISYSREFYIHNKKPGNKTNFDVIK